MHTFTLPSGPEIRIVEMTGVEEDLLTSQRLIRTGEAVNQALANGIQRVGDNDAPGLPAPRGFGEQNRDEENTPDTELA